MKREIFSLRMPPELIQRLDSICEEIGHGITRTALIEWACQWYAAAYEANENRPLSQSDMAELMDYLRTKSKGLTHLALVAEDSTHSAHPSGAGGANQEKIIKPNSNYSPKKKAQNKKSSRSA